LTATGRGRVECDDRRAWCATLVSLLELEIEEPLRFAEWTVDGLLQVLAAVPVGGSRP
jgi:hypothetical protein